MVNDSFRRRQGQRRRGRFTGFACGVPDLEKALRFMVGLSPGKLQRTYLADASRVKLGKRAGPSIGGSCQMCARLASGEATKILLKRGRVHAAPHAVQYVSYRNELARTWKPWGNRNPIQRLMMWVIRRRLAKGLQMKPNAARAKQDASVERRARDLARLRPEVVMTLAPAEFKALKAALSTRRTPSPTE